MHPRPVDIGVSLDLQFEHDFSVYIVRYVGRGLEKTAFILEDSGQWRGQVFKIAAQPSHEPAVFRHPKLAECTTQILHECRGVACLGAEERQYHCWVAQRTTHLHEKLNLPGVDNTWCVLGAYYCLLQCADSGFYVSDIGFSNFGIRPASASQPSCARSAQTQSRIVLLDASFWACRADIRWRKGWVNKVIMQKLWRKAKEFQIDLAEIRKMAALGFASLPRAGSARMGEITVPHVAV
jgi:hypothetical protein